MLPDSFQCVVSKAAESCSRCFKRDKVCIPRGWNEEPDRLPRVLESKAVLLGKGTDIVLPTSERICTETFSLPSLAPNGIAEALLDFTPPYNYGRGMETPDEDTLKANSDLDNGEPRKPLSELMGFDPKFQRSEYMKNRRLARKAAHPLLLNQAWRRYSKEDRRDAVIRVFRAFSSKYLHHQFRYLLIVKVLSKVVRIYFAEYVPKHC